MADAVLAVLSGTPAETAAATINTPVTQLIDAVEAYQAAGYQALETCTAERGWYSVYVQFTDWDTAEQAASAVLAPRLDRLNQRGLRTDWWFIRKRPYWRLRIRPLQGTNLDHVTPVINDTLDDLVTSKVITRWRPVIYEPETAAFGGPLGTEIAHELFCTDSQLILSHLQHLPESGIGRKELSMLLCGTLLGAVGLDRFERGDVWHRVAELRPLPAA